MGFSAKKFVIGVFIVGGLSAGVYYMSTWRANVSYEITATASSTPRSYFEPLTSLTLPNGSSVFVSIADSPAERQLGLSHTTALPKDIIKLFVFTTDDTWSFWMKDMQYPIDIVWLDSRGEVVHVEAMVTPDSYPRSVQPRVPARYVIETNASQAITLGLTLGSKVPIDALLK